MSEWQDILAEAGYPTTVVCLDVESYFDTEYSLGKISTIEYISDSRFEFTGLGVLSTEDGVAKFVEPEQIEGIVRGIDYDNVTILEQNCRFDATVFQVKLGVIPKYLIDLKDLASHYDSGMSHRLKDMAKMFGLKPKGETMNFKGLHWSDMTPEQREALAEYTINDVELETELFKLLLPKLSNPKDELALARHTLDLWLHQRLVFNEAKAKQLRQQMRTKMARTISATGHTLKQIRSGQFVTYLKETLPDGEEVPMKPGKNGNIPAIAKGDEACQRLLQHPKQEVRNLIEARLAARSWPTHIKRVNTLIAQAKANGGTLRVPLNYYGGHTGRWSGGEGYNLQNFGGDGRDTDQLVQDVKTLIEPLPGCVPTTIDSAQIEARIIAWLAGQDDLVEAFAKGEDIYSDFASKLFGCEVHKPTKDDPEPLRTQLKIRRNVGKENILGNGYGKGAETTMTRMLGNPKLMPMFDSGEYTLSTVQGWIQTYRKTYAKIPAYWKRVEKAVCRVIRFSHLGVEVGCTKFRVREGTLEIELPSSRVLYYPRIRIGQNQIKWAHGVLYGSFIAQNIDQAIARDLLGYWILEAEKAELPVCLTIHDDVRLMSPEDKAEEQAEQLATIMRSVPEWAAGLPVDVDVQLGKLL